MSKKWYVKLSIALCCGLAVAVAGTARAHHSAAVLYDTTMEITVQGVVTEYQLGNPHMRIYFDVEKDGAKQHWMAEGGSRTVLMRKGWTGTEVAPGDTITVRGNPSRDGSYTVHMEYLTLPDGTELYSEDIDSSALEQIRRRRRE